MAGTLKYLVAQNRNGHHLKLWFARCLSVTQRGMTLLLRYIASTVLLTSVVFFCHTTEGVGLPIAIHLRVAKLPSSASTLVSVPFATISGGDSSYAKHTNIK